MMSGLRAISANISFSSSIFLNQFRNDLVPARNAGPETARFAIKNSWKTVR
jgi:hypothetical protein